MLSQTDCKLIASAIGLGIARESLSDRNPSQLQLQLQLQQLTTSMAGFSPNRPVSDARRASAASTSPAAPKSHDGLVSPDGPNPQPRCEWCGVWVARSHPRTARYCYDLDPVTPKYSLDTATKLLLQLLCRGCSPAAECCRMREAEKASR